MTLKLNEIQFIDNNNKIEHYGIPNKDLTFPRTRKVFDGIEMSVREIPVGAGEVRIGVGYEKRFKIDAHGIVEVKEVPVYITQTF